MFIITLLASVALAGTPEKPAEKPDDSGKRSLQFLAELMSDKSSELRAQAAAAWGEIGNPAAMPFLKKALKDPNPYVRIEAACSLHALGDDGGFPAIESIILPSSAAAPGDKGVRVSSATAKGKKMPPAKPAPQPQDEMRIFAQNKVRAFAISRYSDFGGERAAGLYETTIDDPAPVVRDATAVALAKMGFDELDPVFLDMIKDKNETVRAASAKALGQIARASTVGELRAAAEDPSAAVRAEAVAALGRFPTGGVLMALTKALGDKDAMVRANAVDSLAKVPGEGARDALYKVLKDTANPVFTLKVMEALAWRGDPGIDMALVEKSLQQRDADTSLDAVAILKLSRSEAALPLLRRAFNENGDPRVRLSAAVGIIKRLKRPEDAPAHP